MPSKPITIGRQANPHDMMNIKNLRNMAQAAQEAADSAMATATAGPSASWPVGSLYFSILSTDPATLFGFGTWVRVAEGKFIVGLDSTDTDFDAAEKTGGAKTVDASHDHVSGAITINSESTHTHSIDPPSTTTSGPSVQNFNEGSGAAVLSNENHTHTVDIAAFTSAAGSSHTHTASSLNTATGGSAALSIVPPHYVAYIWKRTA